MNDVVNVLLNILKILQILIIMGFVVMFIYFGILFYLKKFDKVKENIIYPIIGIILLVLSYSLPVIIISFLERGQASRLNNNLIFPRSNSDTDTSSPSEGNFNCLIDGLFPRGDPQIIEEIDLISTTTGCRFNITITTKPSSAYVFCSFKPEIFIPLSSTNFNCWGLYYSLVNLREKRYSRSDYIIDHNPNFFVTQNIQSITNRIFRLPSQDRFIFCQTNTLSSNYINLDKEGEYIYVIFRATPVTNLTNICTTTQLQKIETNVWKREEWEAIKINVLKR